jgi:hypothetical protein
MDCPSEDSGKHHADDGKARIQELVHPVGGMKSVGTKNTKDSKNPRRA